MPYLPPASVTKLMVMLLAMEAIDAGRLKLTRGGYGQSGGL